MKTIQRNIVACMIYSQDKKLFLAKKNPELGGVYQHCWHIPGGGVEPAESLQQATIREVQEETGLDISQQELILVDDDGTGSSEKTFKETGERVICHMKFTVYKVTLDTLSTDTLITLDEELSEYTWASLNDLKNYRLTPPSIELFTKIGLLPTP